MLNCVPSKGQSLLGKMAASASPRPVQERFDAAVSVIKSLPNEGPYQPSNTTKLRFYALYKQVTQGPCTIPKPGFWDAVGRAKWEAWNVCGEMSKEVAMQMYVEELQRLVETMPQTAEVEQFLRSIGPFYEEATNDEQPVSMETTPLITTEMPTETTPDKQADKDATPSEEGGPILTNQIADEAEESEAESDSSAEDFKDSFQELGDKPEGPRRPAVSSPSKTSQTSLLRQQPPISHGNRPTRSVIFAEPVRRESLQSMSALSSGGSKIQLSSPESYPLAIETVRSEISRLQGSIQSMLQQLNTLALAVNGLNRMMSSGERGSSRPANLASQGDGAQLMVPRLVTRRGRLLTMVIKAAPVLAAWPVVVTIVMAIIHKRFSERPTLVWTALSILQAVFTLLVASRLQR